MPILLLDNYDSFTYNLLHYLESEYTESIHVRRNSDISLEHALTYKKIVLSPGPGLPADAGIMLPLLKAIKPDTSILGVCLGMQGIVESFGGKLLNLERPLHGCANSVYVTREDSLFSQIPTTFRAGHYHSWVADPKHLPSSLHILASDEDGNIMAVRHESGKICGVQFHPESVLTEHGKTLLRNWIKE